MERNLADEQTKRGPAGAGRTNMIEDYEIRYWTEKFGCTKAELVTAVGAVGPIATKVEAYLKRKCWSPSLTIQRC